MRDSAARLRGNHCPSTRDLSSYASKPRPSW
jgi:hypothetical protein